MNVIDRIIGWVSPKRALERTAHRKVQNVLSSSVYSGGGPAPRYREWLSARRTPATPPRWEHLTLVRRANDLYRNNAIARGIVQTFADNVVGGTGLVPQSRIRADELGISEERATELRRQAEAAWRLFAAHAGAVYGESFHEIQLLSVMRLLIDGEVFVLPVMRRGRPGGRPILRALQLIDPERVWSSDPRFPHGVETDDLGVVQAYWIEPAGGSDAGTRGQPQRVAARDSRGRPRVLHVFFAERPGQVRGVPPFASAMNLFRDLGDWMEAEIVNQRVAACLSVFVTDDNPYQTAYESYTSLDSDDQMVQELAPGEIRYLKSGKKIQVVDPQGRGGNLETFADIIVRMIGASLGLTPELVTKDFSDTTYSSARTALLEARRRFGVWRALFAQKFCQPIYDLVLEEAYLRGLFGAEDFYRLRHYYTRASWIGPGWGWVDPVKEVRASAESVDMYLSTLADEASAQGRDWEDVVEQRVREQAEIQRRLRAAGITGDEDDDESEG